MQENWKFHHVSVIVRDMNKAIEYYQSLGIGPFPPFIGPSGTTPLTEKKVRGKPMDYNIDLRHAEGGVGQIQFEVIQPLEGETPVKEFLEKKGEGMHHLGFLWMTLTRRPLRWLRKGLWLARVGKPPTSNGLTSTLTPSVALL